MDLEKTHKNAEDLFKMARLRAYPFAVKMIKDTSDIPEGTLRPLRDLGVHMDLCQGFAITRWEGKHVAMLKEDMWCFEPVVGYGLGEPPKYFLEGHNRFPKDVETLEAGSHYAQQFPRLEVGRYVGVAFAPLKTSNFKPDFVMIYCDSVQLSMLLLAREYRDGYHLECSLSSHAACVYGVVPAAQSGECQVAIPCRGDHYRAMAGDDEIIFTIPKGKLEDLMAGLNYVNSTGSKLPKGYTLCPEYPLLESYEKIAKMMGYL